MKETKTSASTANPSPTIENKTMVIPNRPFKIRIPRWAVAFGDAPLSKLRKTSSWEQIRVVIAIIPTLKYGQK